MSEARIKTFKNKARDQAVSGVGVWSLGWVGRDDSTYVLSLLCLLHYLYIGDEKKENRGHSPTS